MFVQVIHNVTEQCGVFIGAGSEGIEAVQLFFHVLHQEVEAPINEHTKGRDILGGLHCPGS